MTEDGDITYSLSLDGSAFMGVLDDLETRSARFGSALNRALRSAVVDGRDLEQVLRGLALRLSDIALDTGLKPLETLFSGAVSKLAGSLAGGVANKIVPFADGGIVSAPTFFPAGGDIGLMGEAGPEAILPLARGSDGKLGVAGGSGQGGPQIVFNVMANDAQSFRKSEAQITAMLARAVGRGRRGL